MFNPYRKIRSSVASFFGIEDDEEKSKIHQERWRNRRLHYYKKQIKPEELEKRDLGLKDELDNSTIKYIHDPYRMPGSRRTTPLSSTSTYARVNRPSKRLRKESVAKMTVKGILTVAVSTIHLFQKEFWILLNERNLIWLSELKIQIIFFILI